MPCYDPRNSPSYMADEVDKLRDEITRLSKRAHAITELLCKAGRAWYGDTDIPQEVIDWWLDHARNDAAHGVPWKESERHPK